MSPTITDDARSWVTATLRAIPRRLLRRLRNEPHPDGKLSPDLLVFLDDVARGRAYEDADFRSWLIVDRGHEDRADREVDALQGFYIVAGPWVQVDDWTGRSVRRYWGPTTAGRVALAANWTEIRALSAAAS